MQVWNDNSHHGVEFLDSLGKFLDILGVVVLLPVIFPLILPYKKYLKSPFKNCTLNFRSCLCLAIHIFILN